jgi:ABC-2 type transport system ATP-binding protein
MLTVSNIRKQYSTVLAVDNVSLQVDRGQILGLLGPIGAGKTTTIRMILNIIRPDAGSITFNGREFCDEIRNSIGYLPEERGLYRKSSLINTILYFASLRGVAVPEVKRRAYDLLQRFDLLNYYYRKVEELSKGNQQKVQFIISVIHQPDLVILDEPFSGLDPINQIVLHEMLMELKRAGKAIIFSTHQMEQAEKLCDTICLINKGSVVLDGHLSEIKKRYGNHSMHLEFEGNGESLATLSGIQIAHLYENYAELILENSTVPSMVLREIMQRCDNIEIRKFELSQPSLNAIFLDRIGSIHDSKEKERSTG